ncbi:radical SAM protein [Alteromonas sp. KUL49]|uniref:radical SAM protein n=1 Tax=Alteromonas sp. KUL49 TaxID=2480798 RepID=UPI00102EDFF7|nr:radical SAM protein [Alteromonas sp. KUL49]TAP39820.1 radical SAM protein [Alteromonas sp. KUL49]GEA11826.1 hypothetical protein KUL49_22010 [Alteromonas sp. KUL49]
MTSSVYSETAFNIAIKGKSPTIPQSVEIDLTNSCNQDCSYCNTADFRAKTPDQTKIHHYHKLIEQLVKWGYTSGNGSVKTITFVGGGEPTVRKGYEYVVEQAIDSGFLTSIVTNGSYLDRLSNLPDETIKQLSWVGIDIDSGDPNVYESVRRSKTKGLYDKVKDNVRWLTSINNRVDVKVLLHPETVSYESLSKTFEYGKVVGARMLYFRIAVLKDGIFIPPESTYKIIEDLSLKFGVKAKVNKTRLISRNYKKCHALFMLPVFCSDGNVYMCCENRGNPNFSLGSWVDGDFWEKWGEQEHKKMYNDIDVKLCQPCRPHVHNIKVEESLVNHDYHQELFL